jgi:ribosome-binding factor A
MAREFTRAERLAEAIQRELAECLRTEVDDARLRRLLVSGVEVSRDLAHARVFVVPATPGDGDVAPEPRTLIGGIERAGGFLRRRLAARLRVRAVPELRFELDRTFEEADRIERLLAAARRAECAGSSS